MRTSTTTRAGRGILFLGLLGLFGATQARAGLLQLNFKDATCGNASCSNFGQVDQAYGDIQDGDGNPIIDVIWDADRTAGGLQNLRYYGSGFGDLEAVGYGINAGGGLSILFQATTGWEVMLRGFSIAPFGNNTRSSSLYVKAGADVLRDIGDLAVDARSDYSFDENWSQSVLIELGPDAYNVGISNIDYGWREAIASNGPPSSAVPLPASAALLLSGLFGIGLRRGHRRDYS